MSLPHEYGTHRGPWETATDRNARILGSGDWVHCDLISKVYLDSSFGVIFFEENRVCLVGDFF